MYPYDSKVEYIETTGTQYFDTEFVPNFNTEVRCVAAIINWPDASATLIGANTDNGLPGGRFLVLSHSDATNHRTVMADSVIIIPDSSIPLETNFTFIFNENGTHNCYLNNNYVTTFASGNNVVEQSSLYISGANGYIAGKYLAAAKFYSIQIFHNGELVRDLIPVRIGNIGAFYDKITWRLLKNKGTGNVLIGEDVEPEPPISIKHVISDLLLRRRIIMNIKDILPYDSIIEYIETTGTQYVDTEIIPSFDTEVSFKVAVTDFMSSGVVLGTNTAGGTSGRFLPLALETGTSQSKRRTVMAASQIYITTEQVPLNTWVEMIFNENNTHKVYLNGNVITTFTSGTSVTQQKSLYLSASNGYSDALYLSKTKFMYVKIKKNGVLVRDFVPVRVGTTGYMYDKVTKQLFGNQGTGDFILGPDI